jgi:hypothetical protein
MGTRRNATVKWQATSADEQWTQLERLWAVATCDVCGAPIVLGERAGHSHRNGAPLNLCSSCQALPLLPPLPQLERVHAQASSAGEAHRRRLPGAKLRHAA